MVKKLTPLVFPIILAIFPALSLYVHNMYQVRFPDVVWVLLPILVIVVVLVFGLRLLYGNIHKAAILTATLFLLFFSYGHAKRSMSYLFSSLGILDKTKYLVRGDPADILWLVVWVVLFILIAFLLYKYQKDPGFATKFLNILSGVVLLTVAVEWGIQVYRQPTSKIDAWIAKWVDQDSYENSTSVSISKNDLPDIYYIILDAMTGEDVLREIYHTDISTFRAYLDQKGFYIADQSRSNYAWTELSLASSLNFMYLDELQELGIETSDTKPLEIMIENNRLFDILRNEGYQIVTFSDEYQLTDISSSDIYLAPHRWVVNGYHNELFNTTPLPVLFRVFSLKSPYELHRDHVLFMFTNLASSPDEEKPKFVFAHFMVPHPPFVFGVNGEPVFSDTEFTFNYGVDQIGRDGYISGYGDQVAFVTKKITEELEKIINRDSSRPLIVLIQGDHGPSLGLDWTSLENSDLNERMSIFNAYYFSDGDYQLLNPQMTPVNSFRVILNQYFNINIPLLENKNYFTLVYHPYDFLDVTSALLIKAER